MRIDVAFLPSLLKRPQRTALIVIDVLRATSTLVTLAGSGVASVTVVPELEQAFALKLAAEGDRSLPLPLLCGEVRGLPPEGFDYGNSPEEFSRVELAGRRVVLYTSNGTRALVSASEAAAVFVGSLLNRTAAAETAVQTAQDRDLDMTMLFGHPISAPRSVSKIHSCAGALVAGCLGLEGPAPTLGDGAQTALRLYQSFAGDARAAFAAAEHGGLLATIGLGADIDFCAQLDRYAVVPRVNATTVASPSRLQPLQLLAERGEIRLNRFNTTVACAYEGVGEVRRHGRLEVLLQHGLKFMRCGRLRTRFATCGGTIEQANVEAAYLQYPGRQRRFARPAGAGGPMRTETAPEGRKILP